MSGFTGDDTEAPLIPPKRSSGGSNNDQSSTNTNGTMDPSSLAIYKEASKFDFFHGTLSNKEVERRLRPFLQDKGSYLLRKSNRCPGALTFSVVHTANHIYHFNVFFARGKFMVTEQLSFSTLPKLISHFEKNEIPGDGNPGLFLASPISKSSTPVLASTDLLSPNSNTSPRKSPRASPMSTPLGSPRIQRKAADNPSNFAAKPVTDLRPNAANADPGNRPPLPLPRDPIYDSTQHKYGIYAVPDDPDRDRFYDIRDLCRRADDEIAKQAKKCTCGLYLYESTLVDNWMMHRDIENTATKGKIFFVNTVTNEATWQLPEPVSKKMEETQPEKWKKIKALLQRENRESAKNEAASDV